MLTDFDSQKCPDFNPNNDFQACFYFDPAPNPKECGFCKQPKYYRCIAHKGVIPLSHSMIQKFLTCHYLCYLTSIRGVQTLPAMSSSALKCGKLWDCAISNLYRGLDRKTGKPYDMAAVIKENEIESRDVAKVRALYKAYKFLEIQIDENPTIQPKIDLSIPFDYVWGDGTPVEIVVTGYYDRKYPDYFVENKLSSRPDFYLDPFFIQSQVGTYFMADHTMDYCMMEVVRIPDLKSTGSHKEEDSETYGERCFQDIISRPSHYFIGWNSMTRRYGKKYYRSEFNLEELRSRYLHIFREYFEARAFNGWYKNDKSCSNVLPGIQCEMIPLCRHNNMSETIYQVRRREQ